MLLEMVYNTFVYTFTRACSGALFLRNSLMKEDLDISCPALYLGQARTGKLNGGWSSYLPEELCLYFANMYPQPGIHIFVTSGGFIRTATTQQLFSIEVWRQILSDDKKWPQNHFVDTTDMIANLITYFGILK